MEKPELLAPGGSLEKLKYALDFGADAVYIGGSKLNLRAFADNFTNDEIKEGVAYAHNRGRKVYVTLNVFPHNKDIEGLTEYLKELNDLKIDAIIASDPGIIMTIREVIPDMEIHISTQANNVNYKSAIFWHNFGVKRVILARELSISEIKEIREKTPKSLEIEAFVHGAMCMAYSGRCMLSNYMTGRDSNRGECAQPCRYKYYLMEEKREGQYFRVFEDDKGTYILNSKDMCTIEHIPELVGAGITSFKIEGRMKSSYYVASIVKAYRSAIDSYFEDKENYSVKDEWLQDVDRVSHREYYTGFYFNDKNSQIHKTSSYIRNYDIAGIVVSYDKINKICEIEQRNKVFEGDLVEILRPVGDNISLKLINIRSVEGEKLDSTKVAQMHYFIDTDIELSKNDMLVKAKEE